MGKQLVEQWLGESAIVDTGTDGGEGQFHRLLETLPLPAFTCDSAGLITYFNSLALKVWGRAPTLNDAVDRYCASFEFSTPDGYPIDHEESWMGRVLKDGNGYSSQEIVFERPDGSRVTALAHSNPILDREGTVRGAVNVLVDISEQKQTETALRESEEYFRSLFESEPFAVFLCDKHGVLQRYNRTAAECWGREPVCGDPNERFCGSLRLWLPDGTLLPHTDSPLVEVLRTGISRKNVEVSIERPDGTRLPVVLNFTALKDAEGEVVGAVTSFVDITERKRGEALLVGQKQVLELLATGAPLRDVLGTLIRLIENQSEGLVGSILLRREHEANFCMGVAPSLPENFTRELENGPVAPPYLGPCGMATHLGKEVITADIATDGRWSERWRKVAADSELKTCFSAPIVGSDGRVLGSFAMYQRDSLDPKPRNPELLDVATKLAGIAIERREAEQAIYSLNAELDRRVVERTAQLEESNRELETYAYSVSHDLRAPLRGIDGFSQVLEDDYHGVLDEMGRQYLRRIRSGAQRMSELIDDLLKLSRLSNISMQMEFVDLSALANRVMETMRESEPERQVDVKIQEDLQAWGDPGLLAIALENLLENAMKFTGKRERAVIEVGAKQEGGRTVVYVRDNGVGFDMVYVDKLFRAFQRLHSPGDFSGTGIGLAIVHRVVHKHSGRVWAESQVGEGATFFMSLPTGPSQESAIRANDRRAV